MLQVNGAGESKITEIFSSPIQLKNTCPVIPKRNSMKNHLSFSPRKPARWLSIILLLALLLGFYPAQKAQAAPQWWPVNPMILSRSHQTATLLPDGRVLVVGGKNNTGELPLVEIFNPLTNTWTNQALISIGRFWHTATLLPDGRVLVAGGETISGSVMNTAYLFIPQTGTWIPAGNMLAARSNHTATLLTNGRVLVVGGWGGSSQLNSAEIYNPSTNTWSPALPFPYGREGHSATLLPDGKVLVAGGWNGGALNTSQVYNPTSNTWATSLNPLTYARAYHTATLMPDGTVIVVGGYYNGTTYVSATERYTPATNRWTTVSGGSLITARRYHTATLLPSGKLLVSGGEGAAGALTSAELFNPTTGVWATTTSLVYARQNHTATLLPDGRLLAVGGYNGTTYLNSAEIYLDLTAGAWSSPGSMSSARSNYTATLLPDGRVLAAGGRSDASTCLSTADLFDPTTNTWSSAAAMNGERAFHTATLLADGRVLVAGGLDSAGVYLSSAEIYIPSGNTWSSAASMGMAGAYHTAALLPDGRVLVAGISNGASQTHVEVYDPAADRWSVVASLNTARSQATAALLANGKLLLVGGVDAGGATLASTELYDPLANTWTTKASMGTARASHTMTLLPTGNVLVTGGKNAAYLSSVEEYNPTTNAWTTRTVMIGARANHTATLLSPNTLLVAGGMSSSSTYLNTAQLYDLTNGVWRVVTANMNAIHADHTATLLPNGKVLVAGGMSGSASFSSASDLLDAALGFQEVWRPTLNTPAAPASLGSILSLSGSGWRGYQYGEASSGGVQSSATNFPLVWLRRVDNGQSLWLSPYSFSATAYSSRELSGISAGPLLATVFVNGIPSQSKPISLVQSTTTTISAPAITYSPVATITVTVASSAAIPGGVATLTVGGGAPLTGVLMPVYGAATPRATAVFTLTAPTAGTYSLAASYAAQNTFSASTATGSLVVSPAGTTSALQSSANPSAYGQMVTLTATVAPLPGVGVDAPTGVVTFTEGASVLGVIPLVNGVATLSTATLGPGTYAISAQYSGDQNYTPSSTTLAGGQVVNRAAAGMLLSSSLNPSTYGQTVIFTAALSGSGEAGVQGPTGVVTFTDGATVLGFGWLVNGIASFETARLAVGSHPISIQYGGDGNYLSGNSALAGGQTVNEANVLVSLASTASPMVYGDTAVFTVTVGLSGVGTRLPSGCLLSGSVTLKDGAATLETLPLDDYCQAVFSTAALAPGQHILQAEYSGDASYGAGSSNLLSMTSQVPTLTVLAASQNPAQVGATLTLTATVTGTSEAGGLPDGLVVFKDDGVVIGSAPVINGVAVLQVSTLKQGAHHLTAEYAGSSKHSASASTMLLVQLFIYIFLPFLRR